MDIIEFTWDQELIPWRHQFQKTVRLVKLLPFLLWSLLHPLQYVSQWKSILNNRCEPYEGYCSELTNFSWDFEFFVDIVQMVAVEFRILNFFWKDFVKLLEVSAVLHALSLDELKLIYKARGTFHRLFCNYFVKVQRKTNDNWMNIRDCLIQGFTDQW